MSRKTYRRQDFERWLKRHPYVVFYGDECSCPIAQWTGEEITYDRMETLPAWVNRFIGRWEQFGRADTGASALAILRVIGP
jgi:hypothetical protein